MRTTILSTALPNRDSGSGASITLALIAQALRDRGHDVSLCPIVYPEYRTPDGADHEAQLGYAARLGFPLEPVLSEAWRPKLTQRTLGSRARRIWRPESAELYPTSGSPLVVNLLRVPGEHQVMLQVTVAEVNRAAARSIGLNFNIFNNRGALVAGSMVGNVTPPLGTGFDAEPGGDATPDAPPLQDDLSGQAQAAWRVLETAGRVVTRELGSVGGEALRATGGRTWSGGDLYWQGLAEEVAQATAAAVSELAHRAKAAADSSPLPAAAPAPADDAGPSAAAPPPAVRDEELSGVMLAAFFVLGASRTAPTARARAAFLPPKDEDAN